MRCLYTFHRARAQDVILGDSPTRSASGIEFILDCVRQRSWQTHCRCGSGDGVVDLQLGEQSSERVIKRVNIAILHVLLFVEKAAYQYPGRISLVSSALILQSRAACTQTRTLTLQHTAALPMHDDIWIQLRVVPKHVLCASEGLQSVSTLPVQLDA